MSKYLSMWICQNGSLYDCLSSRICDFVKSAIAHESQLIGEIPLSSGNTLDYPPPCSVMDPHLVLEPKSIACISLSLIFSESLVQLNYTQYKGKLTFKIFIGPTKIGRIMVWQVSSDRLSVH